MVNPWVPMAVHSLARQHGSGVTGRMRSLRVCLHPFIASTFRPRKSQCHTGDSRHPACVGQARTAYENRVGKSGPHTVWHGSRSFLNVLTATRDWQKDRQKHGGSLPNRAGDRRSQKRETVAKRREDGVS